MKHFHIPTLEENLAGSFKVTWTSCAVPPFALTTSMCRWSYAVGKAINTTPREGFENMNVKGSEEIRSHQVQT